MSREVHVRVGERVGVRFPRATRRLLLINGGKPESYRLRDEFQTFLAKELQLELAVEKMHVTHVNDGFNFLGFHVQRYVSGHNRPKLLVTPRDKAQQRLKAKVAVLRGWITY